jgi:hypothetical protein
MLSKSKVIFVTIFLLAVAVRLVPLFGFTGPDNAGPGWYTDTYHHWQIGYLSKEIGFKQGFLRLWDLKGMEYFWGIGHPLILALLFMISRSSSLLVPRLLSTVCGAVIAGLIAVLVKRRFNSPAAWAAGLWVALQPVAIFSDQIGMQEPLGLMFLMLGIYFWPGQVMLTGIFLGLAGTVRAEFWLFSLGLMGILLLREKGAERRMLAGFGYLIVTAAHMKILLDKTQNVIYPIYWNFLANAKGEWLPPAPGTQTTAMIALGLKLGFAGLILLGLLVLWKKPKGYLLWSLGLFDLGFLAFMGGFSAYVYYYSLPRFYVDRLWAFPYSMLGVGMAVGWFWWLPKKIKGLKKVKGLNWAPFLAILAGVSLVAWPFIINYFNQVSTWKEKEDYGQLVGVVYEGGKVLIPQDRPVMTYNLIHFQGIKAENIVGQMFDQFYYLDADDPFRDWGRYRQSVINWLKEDDIRLIVLDAQRVNGKYGQLVKREPELFDLVVNHPPQVMVYRVKL